MVGHGRVLHLDEAAESVYMGDTTIADLRIVAPDVVYVYGRRIGSTNLVAISADQKVRANVAFRVVEDPGSANKASRELQPTTHTNLKLFGNRVAAVGPSVSLRRRPPWSARLRSRLSSKPMPGPNSGLVFK